MKPELTRLELLMVVEEARHAVIRAVLTLMEHQMRINDQATRAEDEAEAGWHLEYLEDELALACRKLTEAIEVLPDDGSRPAGWATR